MASQSTEVEGLRLSLNEEIRLQEELKNERDNLLGVVENLEAQVKESRSSLESVASRVE